MATLGNIHVDGQCIVGGECRVPCTVYQATCKLCNATYIGSSAQLLKQRICQHLNDTQAMANGRATRSEASFRSDTFAQHFADHLKTTYEEGTEFRAPMVRRLINVGILYKGNPISLTKTFGTRGCRLCMEERCQLLKARRNGEPPLMNSSIHLMRGCHHKPKLHRFVLPSNDGLD